MTEMMHHPNDLNWHVRLRRVMVEYFDEDEIEALCFDLRVDYEELEGENKSQKIISLIKHLARLEQIDQLIQLCSELRPNVPWSELRTAAQLNPLVERAVERAEEPQPVAAKLPQPGPNSAGRIYPAHWPLSPTMTLVAVIMVGVIVTLIIVIWSTRPEPATTALTNDGDSPSLTTVEGRVVVPTAVGAGQVLLSEDFESGPAQDWHSESRRPNPAVVMLPDSNHALQLRQGVEGLYGPAWDWPVNDYRVEADVMVADLQPDTSIGWNVRLINDNSVGYCQGYRAEVGPDYAALHLITATRDNCDANWNYEALNYGEFVLKAGEWHHLRLDVAGNKLRFFIDGDLALTATDKKNVYSSGGIGLIVFDSQEAYADNVVVTMLSPSASEN